MKIIWLCDRHHVDYHDGKIALFEGKLWWDPDRLTHVGKNVTYPKKKYDILKVSTRERPKVKRPNTSFQRTRVRGGRGLGPLNSKRYVGDV